MPPPKPRAAHEELNHADATAGYAEGARSATNSAGQAAAGAHGLHAEKQRQEDLEQRAVSGVPDPDWPSGGTGQFENGAEMLVLGGIRCTNGVELPANLATGSCVGLSHDFDPGIRPVRTAAR